MTQRAEASKTDWWITDVATAIGRHVDAWRVVLFGSQARGDAREHSDYDLYVEVDVPRGSLRDTRDEIWRLLSTRPLEPSIDIHVHSAGEIERRSGDPGTIEWDVAREGVVLYAGPGAPRLSVPTDRVSEPSRPGRESVGEWLEAANEDMTSARLLLDGGMWRSACFHLQQTCEKRLKALLVSRGARPPRTHELQLLLAKLRSVGCELPGLDETWGRLSEYAVDARYPGVQVDEGEARAALAAAERVATAVTAAMSHPG